MEVITEITQSHFVVLVILGIISTGIICVMLFRKFLNYKEHEDGRKHVLESRIDKVERGFKQILEGLVEIDMFLHNKEIEKIELEVMRIRGIAKHQLGHMTYLRCLLK